MQKYSLELAEWGEWKLERDFSSFDRAKEHGLQNFPQNEWRIFDRVAGAIIYQHDPFAEIETQAKEEVRRFAETERWRTFFAERAARDVIERQNRERMREVAARQRRQQQRQREQEDQRRNRLRGFNFVGETPPVLNRRYEYALPDLEDDLFERSNPLDEKVNWMLEGF